VGVVESLEVRVLPAEQLDSGTKIFPGCLLSLDLQGKTAQWAHHEASELERQVLELWQVSIENVKSLVETEGDKREVILNFCTLNAKYFLLCGKLSDYEEKKIQLLENLEKLKTTLDGAHPIISATWEQIDNLKFACS
jgi:hypothetical protein